MYEVKELDQACVDLKAPRIFFWQNFVIKFIKKCRPFGIMWTFEMLILLWKYNGILYDINNMMHV